MIPKTIHYCWLSEEPMPLTNQHCLQSWERVLGDYEFVKWDAERFDTSSVPFVRDACKAKKWAFAADYIRLYTLYHSGGVYLDTDLFVLKRFDEYLGNRFFTSLEVHPEIVRDAGSLSMLNDNGLPKTPGAFIEGIQLQAAFLASEKGHPFLRDCMLHYEHQPFLLANGKYNTRVIAPDIYAQVATSYGFVYHDKTQRLKEDMLILPSDVVASHPNLITEGAVAVHFCAGSWREPQRISLLKRIMDYAKENRTLRKLLGKTPLYEHNQTYTLAAGGQVVLKLYSLRGAFFLAADKGYQTKGKHTHNWQNKNIPSGRYFGKVFSNRVKVQDFILTVTP